MDRRELLKMIALVTGGVVVGGEVFLSGCKSDDKTTGILTKSNIALLDEVAETIIPATNTPGAKAAKVGEFMNVMVTDCYTKEQQDAFTKGITALEEATKKAHDKSFIKCTAEERHNLLVALEKEAKAFNKTVGETDKARMEEYKAKNTLYDYVPTPPHYYTLMKQLTLLGFFTSKTGMTETLRHEPVPGKYNGAFPYAKGDKAWAE